MATWEEVSASAPEFAARVRERFDAHRHKTMATVRRDGSPRISGIEADFRDGELWFGCMWSSRKALDLRRDPRFALHSASVDPPEGDPGGWAGDAKLAGRAVEVDDPARKEAARAATGGGEPEPEPFHLFRADVTEVVITRVGDPPDHLLIELWREGEGLRTMKRS